MKENPVRHDDPAQRSSQPAEPGNSGETTGPNAAAPSQQINFGSSAQFGGPVQFGNTQNIQNNYYSHVAPQPELSDPIEIDYFEPETIYIPAGPFVMGSPPGPGIPAHETPQHEPDLSEYRIGKYPITNAQYEEFIRQTGRPVTLAMGWDGQRVPAGLEQHPVSGISWLDAVAYCRWLSEKTNRKYSLPNEAQWEKACRAGKNVRYPWGNDFDPKRSNQGCSTLAAVDAYPAQNDFGCFDLVGNVRQWTCSLWGEKRITPEAKFAYPWKDDRRNDLNANRQIRRVVRGSSFKDDPGLLRCSNRSGQLPDDVGFPEARHGFRVVMLTS